MAGSPRSSASAEDDALRGCIRTLVELERGTFPDAACLRCGHLPRCQELERAPPI